MSITIVRFTLNHDASLIPTAAWHITRFLTTNYLSQILLATEEDFHIFVQTTTTIETSINDDTIAMIVLTKDI